MVRRTVTAGAVLLALALAGCGGGPSLSAFKNGFATDKSQFTKLGSDLAAAIQSARNQTNTELASEFGALSSRAKQQAAQLRKLDLPSKFAAQVKTLAGDFDAVGADLGSIASAAKAADAGTARAAYARLLQHAAALRTVDRALTGALGLPQTGS